jgi:hypothetical protein
VDANAVGRRGANLADDDLALQPENTEIRANMMWAVDSQHSDVNNRIAWDVSEVPPA